MNKTKYGTYAAVLWSFIERFASEITAFLISIVLARLLSPTDYGIVGVTAVFISIFSVIIESGFSNALIRKLDRDDSDLATAFYFNTTIGFVGYFILFFSSSLIADYFDEQSLSDIIKVVSVIIIINSLCIVPNAILTSHLNIKKQAYISICSQVPSGILAICCAYYGLGLWSLVVQQVLTRLLTCIFLWKTTGWIPKKNFSMESFRYLWGFGSKLLFSTMIGTIFNNAYSFLIGKYIGKAELGYYTKGQGLANHISSISNGMIQKIGLPLLAKYQNDITLLRDKFRAIMCLITMLIAPLSSLFFFQSKEIIIFLWTEKWINTAPLFKIIICTLVTGPIGAMSLNLFQVVNRTDITLKLELFKKTVFAIVIFLTFQYGIYALLFGMLFNNTFAALINMYPTKNILGYSYYRQLLDLSKYIVLSYLLGFTLYCIIQIQNTFLYILIYTSIYIFLYAIILYIFKDKYFTKYIIIPINKFRYNK